MGICEVYAQNIMPQEIARFLGVPKEDTESIEKCREDFLAFLLLWETLGVLFYSQESAWNFYTAWEILYSEKNFDYLDVEEEELVGLHWQDELLRILDGQAVETNYDENLGQM